MNYPFPLTQEPSGLHAVEHMATEVEYLKKMLSIIRGNGFKRILEIGTYKGHSTFVFDQAFEDVRVVTVDPVPQEFDRSVYKHTTFIAMDSQTTMLDFLGANQRFDFIFIDGDHSYDGVRIDFELGRKLLAPLGMIAFHDTAFYSCTVGRLIDEHRDLGDWEHFLNGKGLSLWREKPTGQEM